MAFFKLQMGKKDAVLSTLHYTVQLGTSTETMNGNCVSMATGYQAEHCTVTGIHIL